MKYRNLDTAIKFSEDHDLDEDLLMKMVDNKSNFLTYDQLEKHNDIESVLGQHGCCLLLYQSSRWGGHYCCIFKSAQKENHLVFFDSYGAEMDTELQYSDFNIRQHNGQVVPHLSSLVANSKYTVSSNKYQYQRDSTEIATCGNHTAVRINLRKYSPHEYQKFLTTNKGHQTPDWIVTEMTILFRNIF